MTRLIKHTAVVLLAVFAFLVTGDFSQVLVHHGETVFVFQHAETGTKDTPGEKTSCPEDETPIEHVFHDSAALSGHAFKLISNPKEIIIPSFEISSLQQTVRYYSDDNDIPLSFFIKVTTLLRAPPAVLS